VGNIAEEGVQNRHHWSRAMNGCQNDDMIELGPLCSQLLFQFIQINDAYFVHLFFQYSPHPIVNWIQIGKFKGYSWGGINSRVSFCNNSMVAHVRWALQVSQVSVETLFRWGGKHLYVFVPNLFRKRQAKFYEFFCMSFIEDITKTF